MQQVFRLQPLYQERVWGGQALATALGRTLPADRPIGESWEIVDRPEAQARIAGGPLAGKTLREALLSHGDLIMGPGWDRQRPFPILVKWLDCRERLSLQVHPPASVAESLQGEPKTENWYIAEAAPGAGLIVGLRRGVTREQFVTALRETRLESCVHWFPVQAGDSILVRSGQIHAIDAGNLILEIQQNSDTTYRVYDWGRVGLDGKPRQMHVEQSLKSIDWNDVEPSPIRAEMRPAVIAEPPEFRIRRVPLRTGERLVIAAHEEPRILSVVTGRLRQIEPAGGAGSRPEVSAELVRGDNVIVPFAGAFVFVAPEPAVLLITENFF